MSCLWLGILIVCSLPVAVLILLLGVYYFVRWQYLDSLLRYFKETPLFIFPRGEPSSTAEDIRFPTTNGLQLQGCYFKTEQLQRKGVILFGLEFGSNRWSCQPYCEKLLQEGYDIFAFEPRNQGNSDRMEGYHSLHWLTTYEVEDTQAAIAYLKSRSDADPKGIGFFGISKGSNAGIVAAAADRYVRCVATDGAFGTYTTMVPYMRRWVVNVNSNILVHGLLPGWFYGAIAMAGIRRVQRETGSTFAHVETALRRFKRPLLMIHGESDTYIKVAMARALLAYASGPKAFWIVNGAKHNQALQIAGHEYHRRICGFFNHHLAGIEPGVTPDGDPPISPVPVFSGHA